MKYMIMMFREAAGMMETEPPAWIKEMIGFMVQIDKDLRDSGELVFQAGLTDGSTAKLVRLENGVPVATDGPFAESPTPDGGVAPSRSRAARSVKTRSGTEDKEAWRLERGGVLLSALASAVAAPGWPPEERHTRYFSDPDGNGWAVKEIRARAG